MTAPHIGLMGHYPPPFGGVGTLMKQMAAALRAEGYRVTVYNLGPGRPRGEGLVNVDRRHRALQVAHLERILRRDPPTLFHYVSASYRSFWLGAVIQALAVVHRRPLVWSLVGGGFRDFVQELDPLRRRVVAVALGRAAAVIPCNREIAAEVAALQPNRTAHLITNSFPLIQENNEGVPPGIARFLADRSPVLCTTASSSPEYGLFEALEALAELVSERPKLGFVIALTPHGVAANEEALMARIDALGLADHVHVEKGVPDFLALLQVSDLFLRPTRVDGDSISVREALYVGLPVVASDTPFRPAGVNLFAREDARDMARVIRNILAGERQPAPPAQEEAAANMRTLVELYERVAAANHRENRE